MRFRTGLLAAAAAMALGLAAPAAHAQVGAGGVSADVAVTTARARITGIDAKTRTLTVRGPAGNVFKLVAGPDVRNFAQIRKGDDIVVRYTQSVAYVISPADTKLPDVAAADGAVRAAPGAKPGGAVGERVAITGTIVGVDPAGHVLSVVDQHGGPVHNFAVVDPERQAQLPMLKVGDKITAVFTEAVAIAVEPARKH